MALHPGVIVEGGGDNGAGCAVPVEVISTVDICTTSAAQQLDTFAGCFNGSPRSGKATASGQTWVSDDTLVFGLRTLSDTNCCMTTAGCLKFTQTNGCNGNDTTTVAYCWRRRLANSEHGPQHKPLENLFQRLSRGFSL